MVRTKAIRGEHFGRMGTGFMFRVAKKNPFGGWALGTGSGKAKVKLPGAIESLLIMRRVRPDDIGMRRVRTADCGMRRLHAADCGMWLRLSSLFVLADAATCYMLVTGLEAAPAGGRCASRSGRPNQSAPALHAMQIMQAGTHVRLVRAALPLLVRMCRPLSLSLSLFLPLLLVVVGAAAGADHCWHGTLTLNVTCCCQACTQA
eukprot:22026-Chlamydomonas_euryale.AAC.2